MVLTFDVHIKLPQFAINKLPYVDITMFRSLATTQLFFKDFNGFCASKKAADCIPKLQEYRTKIRQMVESININNGWTVVGWYKAGTVGDAANKDGNERIANTVVTVHISHLQPTDKQALDMDTFKSFRLE